MRHVSGHRRPGGCASPGDIFHRHVLGTRLRRIDLAERLGLTASGVTRTLIPLEKLGLVERQPDPRDARVGYALLTHAGQQLLRYALVTVQPIAQEATQSMSTDQLSALSARLGQLAGIHLSNT